MDEAGLIVASIRGADDDPYYYAQASRLTWDGCEFLASVKDNKVWSSVKMDIAKAAADAPLPVIKALATKALGSALGL